MSHQIEWSYCYKIFHNHVTHQAWFFSAWTPLRTSPVPPGPGSRQPAGRACPSWPRGWGLEPGTPTVEPKSGRRDSKAGPSVAVEIPASELTSKLTEERSWAFCRLMGLSRRHHSRVLWARAFPRASRWTRGRWSRPAAASGSSWAAAASSAAVVAVPVAVSGDQQCSNCGLLKVETSGCVATCSERSEPRAKTRTQNCTIAMTLLAFVRPFLFQRCHKY